MTIDQFITKNITKIYHHLCQEGYELGYTDDEIDGYYNDTKCFIFAGTKEEMKQEPGNENFYIIAEDDDLVIAEVFSGINYNFI